MKIPRDLMGSELVKLLRTYGYEVSRQTGSHLRLTTQTKGEHHITIPNHSPIKVGTLSPILSEVAIHLEISRNDLMNEFFG
ncbi:MAG: type II toxin-antitoxin system HicA family toxin [Chitinophagales bacterium]|nr:type II toxin-antitoxin system HicA family toxin [Chitinophagales bacterium]